MVDTIKLAQVKTWTKSNEISQDNDDTWKGNLHPMQAWNKKH